MRQKRAKAYRKLMHLYCMNFGFRQPYQVLIDSEMCLEAVSSKIDFAKQLANVLQGTVKPMITQCSIHTLYLRGREAQPAVDLAKMFERRRCNHRPGEDGAMKPEDTCVGEVVGPTNKHRYVVAAQSTSLRAQLRRVPGVPIVHVKRSVMVLEPVSDASERVKEAAEEGRMNPSLAESTALASTSALATSSAGAGAEPPKKKRKGPKGPNPLSVKKKKPANDGERRPRTGLGEHPAAHSRSGRPKSEAGHKPTEGAEAGKKRKRTTADSDSGEVGEGPGIGAGMAPEAEKGDAARRGRKRKRRKQAGGAGVSEVAHDINLEG